MSLSETTAAADRAGVPDASALRGLCGGAVYLPGDAGYDEARMPWNVLVDERPAAVAYPAFPDEVAEVLRAARDSGLRVAPQGTGHGAAPLEGRLSRAVLLRTTAMTEVHIDAERRIARVGAGVQWGDVVERAGAVGLAARHMSSPDVGVVGSTLGGGISWYARRYGFQASALIAVEMVLGDGTFVRADDEHDPELVWAARGGGGGIGVVTAMEFDLLPLPAVYAGMLVWDWTEAERVLPAWAEWAEDVPDELTSTFRLFQAPQLPQLPDGVRGRQVAVFDGASVGDPEQAATVLAQLRALRPDIDTFAVRPVTDLARLHLEPEGPTPGYATNILLDELPVGAVNELLRAAGPDSGSTLLIAELRQLGGALSRPASRPGVLDHVDAPFLAVGIGVNDDPATWPRLRQDAAAMMSALAPWSRGHKYLPMEDETAAHAQASAATNMRLAALHAAVDPHGLFVSPHLPAEH